MLVNIYEKQIDKLLRLAPGSPLQAPFFRILLPSERDASVGVDLHAHDMIKDSEKLNQGNSTLEARRIAENLLLLKRDKMVAPALRGSMLELPVPPKM
eukprot:scaffold11092_cov66-Skeletonema_dohrnii-CCMP3373.AAC.4